MSAPALRSLLRPGTLVRHAKGGYYKVLIPDCMWEPDTQPCVVYQNPFTGDTWVRPTDVFEQRFTIVPQSEELQKLQAELLQTLSGKR